MKRFSGILAIGLVAAPLANAANPVLTYHYSMQLHGSTLTINDDKTIVHEERNGVQPFEVAEQPLTDSQFADLESWIKAASSAQLETFTPYIDHAAMGNMYGYLKVNPGQGEGEVVLRDYSLSNTLDHLRMIQTRSSDASQAIINLVNRYVRDDMPLTESDPAAR